MMTSVPLQILLFCLVSLTSQSIDCGQNEDCVCANLETAEHCLITCESEEQCKESNIICKSPPYDNHSCLIECLDKSSCANTCVEGQQNDIHGYGGSLFVNCGTDATESCISLIMICPLHRKSNRCVLDCPEDQDLKACDDVTVILNGRDATDFECYNCPDSIQIFDNTNEAGLESTCSAIHNINGRNIVQDSDVDEAADDLIPNGERFYDGLLSESERGNDGNENGTANYTLSVSKSIMINIWGMIALYCLCCVFIKCYCNRPGQEKGTSIVAVNINLYP